MRRLPWLTPATLLATLADTAPGVGGGTLILHPRAAAYWIRGQDLYEGRFS